MKKKNLILIAVFLSFSAVVCSFFYLFQIEKRTSRTFSIHYSNRHQPYIESNFLGKLENFVIDTGGAFSLRLNETPTTSEKAIKIHKTIMLKDLDGEVQESTEFEIENLNFLEITFSKLYFLINEKNYWQTGVVPVSNSEFKNRTQINGIANSLIGHKVLSAFNLLLDFPNKKLKIYKKTHIPIFDISSKFFLKWKKIPIEYNKYIGPICEINTDQGVKRFLIDTGFQKTTIKGLDDSSITFTLFKLKNNNYGPYTARTLKNFSYEEFDGILGMDFLYDKTLFIDFENNYMYLK